MKFSIIFDYCSVLNSIAETLIMKGSINFFLHLYSDSFYLILIWDCIFFSVQGISDIQTALKLSMDNKSHMITGLLLKYLGHDREGKMAIFTLVCFWIPYKLMMKYANWQTSSGFVGILLTLHVTSILIFQFILPLWGSLLSRKVYWPMRNRSFCVRKFINYMYIIMVNLWIKHHCLLLQVALCHGVTLA